MKYIGYTALLLCDFLMILLISLSSLPGPALAIILALSLILWVSFMALTLELKKISDNETKNVVISSRSIANITDSLEATAVFHRLYTLFLIVMMGGFFASKTGIFLRFIPMTSTLALSLGWAGLTAIIVLFGVLLFYLYKTKALLKYESE